MGIKFWTKVFGIVYILSGCFYQSVNGWKNYVDRMQPRLGYYSGMVDSDSSWASQWPDTVALLARMGIGNDVPLQAMSRAEGCIPDLIPTLASPGFCATLSELESRCSNKEFASSKDCGSADWCCYDPVTSNTTTTTGAPKAVRKPASLANNKRISISTDKFEPGNFARAIDNGMSGRPSQFRSQQFSVGNQRRASVGQFCNNEADCAGDSGLTCVRNSCQCWTSQGLSAARTWACTSNVGCAVLFPGHLCKPSQLCQHMPGSAGYCSK